MLQKMSEGAERARLYVELISTVTVADVALPLQSAVTSAVKGAAAAAFPGILVNDIVLVRTEAAPIRVAARTKTTVGAANNFFAMGANHTAGAPRHRPVGRYGATAPPPPGFPIAGRQRGGVFEHPSETLV